jgi:drug/metabolite transporter (DMT)-like permease
MLFALLAAVGFSFKAVLVKLAYRHGVDAETLLALRMGFALPVLLVMGGWAQWRGGRAPLSAKDWGWLGALGFFGYYVASYLDFLGLKFITAALERLILFIYPTLVIILSALFLGKPVTRRTLLALSLCYAGIALAVAHDLRLPGSPRDVLIGTILVFGSALSYALYIMGNGHVVERIGPTRVTAFATSAACLMAIGQFFALRPADTLLVQPVEVYGLAFAMAILATVLPAWMLSEAIRRLGAGPVSLTGTLGPVMTLGLGWLFLDEALGAAQLGGAALVIIGVLVISRRPGKA